MAYQFFVKGSDDNLTLSADDFFHLMKVLRIRLGEELELVTATFRYRVQVASLNPFTYKIIDKYPLKQAKKPAITLLYALPKGDKLDLVIQKAVEIGVSHIVLVESANCVTKFSDKKHDNKLVRFEKIIKGAAMQSKQDVIPTLSGPYAFNEVIEMSFALKLIAHEKALTPLGATLHDLHSFDRIGILVGPEGGFSAKEVEEACDHGYQSISLGQNVLRSETAAIYALSILHHYKEGL